MADGFTFEVRGMDELKRRLEDLHRNVMDGAAEVLPDGIGGVLEESQRLVPVRTGELRDSGYLCVNVTDDRVDVTVGHSAPHAASVHENPDGRGFKYLEAPWLERPGRGGYGGQGRDQDEAEVTKGGRPRAWRIRFTARIVAA